MKLKDLYLPRRCRLWIFFLSLFIIGPWVISTVLASHDGPDDETYYYRNVTGDTVLKIKWELTKTDVLTLNYQTEVSQDVIITGPDFDTRSWQVIDEMEGTCLQAKRVEQTIVVKGRYRGNPVDKSLAIDPEPWYQSTSLSLREFIASEDSERIFWTIRPRTLTAHKIKATKKEVLPTDTANGHLSLLRIRLSLPGILAPFWKSDYWFSLPEGIFQRFEGPSGPPGSPLTVVTRMDPPADQQKNPGS